MKKFAICLALFATLLFVVSCGGGSKNDDKTDSGDSGETVTDGDTADTDSADTEPGDVDAEPSDNPDTEVSDTTPEPNDDDADIIPEPNDDDTDTILEPSDDDADIIPEPSDDDTDIIPEPNDDDADILETDEDVQPTAEETCSAVSGTWNDEENKCTKTVNCEEKPANTVWNGETSYAQEYSYGIWNAEIPTQYSETEGTCRYKCDADSFFNGSSCVMPILLADLCTAQTLCYNNTEAITCPAEGDFFNQDAQNAENCTAPSFSVKTFGADSVIFDNNTGLIWEPSPSTSLYYQDQAENYCNGLNSELYAGIDSWRVPAPWEIHTIFNAANLAPATDEVFTNMPSEDVFLWTNGGTRTYAFNIYDGREISRGSNRYKVVCVSGKMLSQATEDDFKEISETAVEDKRTHLIWQKDYASNKTWQEALVYCQSLNNETENGWRLPNKNELVSLLNYDKSESPDHPGELYSYSYFPQELPLEYYGFWTSTTHAVHPDNAWEVLFVYGHVSSTSKTFNKNFVKCVKDAE